MVESEYDEVSGRLVDSTGVKLLVEETIDLEYVVDCVDELLVSIPQS